MLKRKALNVIGIAIMVSALVFSVLQLNIPIVNASGCPEAQTIGCNCMYIDGTAIIIDGETHWFCTYLCGSCSGGDEPMSIEQTVYIYN